MNLCFFPLPVIGSLYPGYRKVIGSIQDIPHPEYQELRSAVTEITSAHEGIIFASGHEHSLQHFEKGKDHFIISGSGSKSTYARKGLGASFVHQHKGFSRLSYYENGEVWMEMWVPNEDGSSGTVVYRTQLKETGVEKPLEELDLPEFPASLKNVTMAASPQYQASKFKRFWLGDHYRELWATPVEVPVVNLDTMKGGLTPIKRGGGLQTLSLRMENADGKQFVIRTINKDPSKALAKKFKQTLVSSLVQDGISASNPYGAFIIPPLADAANIMHMNPRLVYVPAQPALGKYAADFGERTYLFEERPNDNRDDIYSLSGPEDFISSWDLLDKIRKNSKHQIDQETVVRARLFDFFVGDWDRHEDQWRWGVIEDEENNKKIYEPVPRDRDQVFFKFDGVLNFLASRKFAVRQFRSFDYEIDYVQGLGFNARWFDRNFTTAMTLEDWQEQAKTLQENITDSVIDHAVSLWPDVVYDMIGADIAAKLKSRREHLVEYAEDYYSFIAKSVDVFGTDHDERFEIARLGDDATSVKVFSEGKNKNEELIYDRIFKTSETNEIRLYGFDGDDQFQLTGEANKGLKVRIIGGGDKDEVLDQSNVKGWRKKVLVYDKPKGMSITGGKDTKDLTLNDDDINDFEPFTFMFNLGTLFPNIGFNVDDGVFLGAVYSSKIQGWRKNPYRYKQQISALYAFQTSAVQFKYHVDANHAIRKWDVAFDFSLATPNYVNNFYGLGNQTVDTAQPVYYRLRGTTVQIAPSIQKRLGDHQRVTFGLQYDFTKVEQTANRIATDPSFPFVSSDFDGKHYGGVSLTYDYNHTDNLFNPTRGLILKLPVSWHADLTDPEGNYMRLAPEMSFFLPFKIPMKTVLATRFGGSVNYGNYEFFQANTLGRNTNLRGFRANRFSGDAAFFQNIDLRMSLGDWTNNVIPMTVGVFGSFDYGTTWLDGENNDVWHRNYGGGLWLSPFDLLVINAGIYISEEGNLFTFGTGFGF